MKLILVKSFRLSKNLPCHSLQPYVVMLLVILNSLNKYTILLQGRYLTRYHYLIIFIIVVVVVIVVIILFSTAYSQSRKMDVLNIDLQLKNEASAKRPKVSQNKNQAFDEDSEAGFHFIAFVPVKGKVWKFDGLERQPQSLGSYEGDDWLQIARPDIISRMAEYAEDQIEFSILSLAKDPMGGLVDQLASNVNDLTTVEKRIATLISESGNMSSSDMDKSLDAAPVVREPDPSLDLTPEKLAQASPSDHSLQKCQTESLDELERYRHELIERQVELRASIRDEQQSRHTDEEYAAGRRHDYGPAIHTWLRFLARKGMIKALAAESR